MSLTDETGVTVNGDQRLEPSSGDDPAVPEERLAIPEPAETTKERLAVPEPAETTTPRLNGTTSPGATDEHETDPATSCSVTSPDADVASKEQLAPTPAPPPVKLVNGHGKAKNHNNNDNATVNNNSGKPCGTPPLVASTTTTTNGWIPTPLAPPYVPPPYLVAGATGVPRSHSLGKRPNRYSSGGPRSRGASPNNQGPLSPLPLPLPVVSASLSPPPPPPSSSAGQAPGGLQHVVHLHVNPGETISFQLGADMQLIHGPATVRMVSNNSNPPIPMPVQVPPGHMVQQIVDENGTLRHVILSPQPAMAVPMGPTYPGPSPNSGPNNPPFYYHPAFSPHAYHPHLPHGPPPPPPHLTHQLQPHGPPTHPCNNHHPHQGPSPPPMHSILGGKDERSHRQFNRLKRKLDSRHREPGNHIVSHFSPPSSPLKENDTKKSYKDRNTSTSGLEEVDGAQEGGGRRSFVDVTNHHQYSRANLTTSLEKPEEERVLTELLTNIHAPQVSQVTARSAFLQWKPPNMYSESGENKYSEYQIQESEFMYELILSDRGHDGKYRVVYSNSVLEYTLPNLKPATEYFACVNAFLDDLRGQPSKAVTFTTLSSEPDVPTPPKMTNRTKTNLTLRWNTVSDNGSKIVSYNLEYDEGKGSSAFQEVYSGLQKQFKVVKLTASTCYRFRLAATNEIGKSNYSDVVCYSTSGSAPSQPTPPALQEAFVNKLHLVWQFRPNDETYTLQMEEATTGSLLRLMQGHGFLPVFNGPETQYVCSGLRRNKEYKFRLCANNEEGTSRWSETVAFLTKPDRPAAPSRPTLKGKVQPFSIRVSWETPKDNGGADISSYALEVDSGSGFEQVYDGVELEHTCDRLLPGHTYNFRVSCEGPGGKSDYSEVGVVATLPVCPGQCSTPRLSGKAKAISLHLKWNYPEKDGGSQVTEYEVDVTNPDTSSRLAYRGRETDCVVAGLLPGRPYQFRVRAYNKAGEGSWSDPLEVMSGAGPPNAPSMPQLQCKSPHATLVTWEEPTSNGAAITEYRLEWSQKEADFVQLYQGSNTSFEVKSLLPATQYSFRIQAMNTAGAGGHSPVATLVTPPAAPAVVASATIRCTCSPRALSLTWAAPDCHGSDIVSYNIDLGDKHSVVAVASDVCEHLLEGLTPETVYRIRIQAVNSVGNGPFSGSVKVSTKALPPPPPRLECVSTNHNSLKMKWGDGKNADLIEYTLEIETKNSIFVPVYRGTALGYKVTKLSETTAYQLRIVASNDAGSGEYSDVIVLTTTKSPPAPVKAPQVHKLTETSCTVNWHSVRPVGEDRTLYLVQLLSHKDPEYKVIYRGDATSHELHGLEPKTEYQVRVGTIRDCRDGSPQIMGPLSPSVTFVTHSREPARVVGATSRSVGNHSGSHHVSARKPLTDQQWAIVILLGFTIFAVLVAVLIEKGITYGNGGAS